MYPFESLVILTPIVFFVLLIGFAVIGVFGGWKRAAYWGGGNFVFYCIGLLVWHFAASSISSVVTPLIKSMMSQTVDESGFAQIVTSVVGPAFFLIFMIIANIILVICYYAFAKRLLGLKKQKVLKEETKAKASGSKQVKVQVQTKKGVVHTKWFNMVVGGVGMTALMLPITFSTTHAVALTTTKSSTRSKNALTTSLYGGLQAISESMDWFSYYNGDDTGKDYDALFSIISLAGRTDITYYDANGNVVTGDAITAVTNTISNGVSNLVNNTKSSNVSLATAETIKPLTDAISNFSTSFDSIMVQCKDDLNAVFNSTGVTSIVKTMISSSEATLELTDETFEAQYLSEGNLFDEMVDAYKLGYIETEDGVKTEITTIENVITTSEEAFNDIVDAVYDMYSTNNLSSTNQALLKEKTAEMISMFITY